MTGAHGQGCWGFIFLPPTCTTWAGGQQVLRLCSRTSLLLSALLPASWLLSRCLPPQEELGCRLADFLRWRVSCLMPSVLSVPGTEDLGLVGSVFAHEVGKGCASCGSVPEHLAEWKGAGAGSVACPWGSGRPLWTWERVQRLLVLSSVTGLPVTACTSWTFNEVLDPAL